MAFTIEVPINDAFKKHVKYDTNGNTDGRRLTVSYLGLHYTYINTYIHTYGVYAYILIRQIPRHGQI